MSLLNSSCCCATTTGRCCILVTPGPGGADCADLCEDNKTPAQCAALGGVWEAGACADIEPNACVGVCCATTTAGYFVACQESVTQCECFSDNLAVGVNTTWTSGANLTCADIACPCQCSDQPCPCIQYIKVKITETTVTRYPSCNDVNYCYYTVIEESLDCAAYAVACDPDGTQLSCPGDENYFSDLVAYFASISITETFQQCGEYGDSSTNETRTILYTAELGAVVCKNSLCTPNSITIGTNYTSYNCAVSGAVRTPPCACQYPNTMVTEPCVVPLYHCNTCPYENCVHEYDDCATCT